MSNQNINNAEYQEWVRRRSSVQTKQDAAVLGSSTAAIGGSSTGAVSSAYKNQQAADGEFAKELKVDAGYGSVPYDMYVGADQGDMGYPVTAGMEQRLLEAATKASYAYTDTIPTQVQVAILLAARKAHNNWKQRRQQLLTHAQMRSANRLAIDADMAKMAAGIPLDGVERTNV
jgi:hypothetical protein